MCVLTGDSANPPGKISHILHMSWLYVGSRGRSLSCCCVFLQGPICSTSQWTGRTPDLMDSNRSVCVCVSFVGSWRPPLTTCFIYLFLSWKTFWRWAFRTSSTMPVKRFQARGPHRPWSIVSTCPATPPTGMSGTTWPESATTTTLTVFLLTVRIVSLAVHPKLSALGSTLPPASVLTSLHVLFLVQTCRCGRVSEHGGPVCPSSPVY